MKTWASLFLSWGLPLTAAAEPATPLRLAILATELSSETRSLADLIPLELQKAEVEIVERTELDRVLAEQSLTAAGLAGGVAGRVTLGKLLRADGFLFVGKTATGERLSARLVETRHGHQVCQLLFRTNGLNWASLPLTISETVQKKLPVLRLSDEKRILIGVLRIGNATLDPRAYWIEDDAPFLLSACLSVHPSILMLERRELGALLDENLMTDSEKPQLRTADLIIDGDVFLASGETLAASDRTLTTVVRVRDGRLNELARFERKGKASNLEQTIAGLASELLAKIGTLRSDAGNLASAEPALLLDIAQKRGLFGQGFWAIEAAYALDVTNVAVRKKLIEGLLIQGRSSLYVGESPQVKRKLARDCAQLLRRATDLILSSPDPTAMPRVFDLDPGFSILGDRAFRRDAKITELLRPVRALGRVEMERDLLPYTDKYYWACYYLFCLFESEAETSVYMSSLLQRSASDPALRPIERQMRTAIILSGISRQIEVNIYLPSTLYDSLCQMDDPVIRYLAHIKAGQVSPSLSGRQVHYREALNLLDGMFDQTEFLKRQAALHAMWNYADHMHYFYNTVKTLHASGADAAREVGGVLARRFDGWIETNDLATLGDVLAFDYFPMLEPKIATMLLDKVMLTRERPDVRLPKTSHGNKMLNQMEVAWKNQKEKRGEAVPHQPGAKIVLLNPQSNRWKEMGGEVYWEFGGNNLALTPQRLLVEGDTLWVALSGYATVRHVDRQVGSLVYSKYITTARTALMQMDLATGRILSYRLESRDISDPAGRQGDSVQKDAYALSPIFLWRDAVCFGDRYAGLYIFPRRCGADEHTFDRVRRIDTGDGLPSLDITAAAALGDTLYIALPTLLLALPDGKGPPRVIAATGTETADGPLAGAGWIFGLAADEDTGRLFIMTNAKNTTNGMAAIWRHVPADGSFTRLHAGGQVGHKARLGGGIIANVPRTLYFTSKRGSDSNDGLLKVNGCFRMDDESLTNRPIDGLPPESFLEARYDFVPYRDGSIAIGGEEKDWELVFFLGKQTTAVEALSWALEGASSKSATGGETRAKADALYAAISDSDPVVRGRAAADLVKLGDPRASEAQIRLLQDPDRAVRRQMAQYLNDGGAASHVPLDLLLSLLMDEDRQTAGRVAFALNVLSDPRSADPLLKALQAWLRINSGKTCNEEEACLGYVVGQIGWALGSLKDTRAIEPLKEVLEMPCVEGRKLAVTALGDMGDPRAIDLLLPMLDDMNLDVRKSAIRALCDYDDPRITKALGKLLRSKSETIRQYAAAKFGDARVKQALEKSAESIADGDIEHNQATMPVTNLSVEKNFANAMENRIRELDLAFLQIRNGGTFTEKEQLHYRKSLSQYYDALCHKHGTSENIEFPEPDRTLFYVAAIKTAFIDPEGNGGWPFRSELRLSVLDQLKSMIAATNDPFLVFCSVFPALSKGDKEYAAKAFETLKKSDEFLAKMTVLWSIDGLNEPEWPVAYYMANGETEKAKEAADMAAATGLRVGMEIKAVLLAKLGQFTQAEACYKEIDERHKYVGSLVGFYRKYRDQKDDKGISFEKHYEQLTKRCFPQGLQKVEMSGLSSPPANGLVFTEENDRTLKYGLRKGTVVCAVDGYRVENEDQYYFIRELDGTNPEMKLIVWNGERYKEVTVQLPSRRFGVELKDYQK